MIVRSWLFHREKKIEKSTPVHHPFKKQRWTTSHNREGYYIVVIELVESNLE
jgi:hypothetical protein